jgi:hypothetical protein
MKAITGPMEDSAIRAGSLKANGHAARNQHEHDEDLILGTVAGLPPKLPQGIYTVGFLRAERGSLRGKGRVFLWFKIVDPIEHSGKELYLCCPLPDNGKFGMGSKFVEAWRIAKGQWPTRRDRLSTNVFRGHYYKACVKTVMKNQDSEERPVDQHYSKIDHLIERVTG